MREDILDNRKSAEAGQIQWVIEQHFGELAEIIGIGQVDQFTRAHAHLEGIQIGGDAALCYARSLTVEFDEVELLIPATIAAVELGDSSDLATIGSLLKNQDPEVRNACRIGLRFANIGRQSAGLESLLDPKDLECSASFADAFAFHRRKLELKLQDFFEHESVYVQEYSFEAAGRASGTRVQDAFQNGIRSNSPRVREAAYRAACRSGLSQLLTTACRTKANEAKCVESISYFGLLSQPNDWQLLQKLLKEPATTVAAMSAIGKCGWVKLVPWLFDYLDSEEFCEPAALAFERITGLTVPRGEPREPPEDLDEDEKDFWVTTGLPETEIIREWWQENSGVFDEQHRYQEGHCVSKNPLPVIANELSPRVALDVYLRERALNHKNTPDWELETWPRYWQNPGWAFS